MKFIKKRTLSFGFALSIAILGVAQPGQSKKLDTNEEDAVTKITDAGQQNATALKQLDDPQTPDDQRQQIQQQVDRRNAQIDAGAKQFPQSPVVNTAASGAALASRDVPKALNYGDKAVSLSLKTGDPDTIVDAYKARAQARLAGGDKMGALEDVKAALEKKRDDADLVAMRGLLEGHAPAKDYKLMTLKLGRQEQAQGASQATSAAPQPTQAEDLSRAGIIDAAAANKERLERQAALKSAADQLELDPRLAEVKLSELVQTKPDDAQAYALKAKAERLLNDPASAYKDAASAVENDPKLAQGYAERALAGATLGVAAKDVAADWSRVAELDPDIPAEYRDAYRQAMASAAGGASSATDAAAAGSGLASRAMVALGLASPDAPSKPKPARLAELLGVVLAAGAAWWLYRRGRALAG